MSSETLSLLLRPQCSPAAHHAAVTSMLFLDDVELLRDRAHTSRPAPLPASADPSRAQSHSNDVSASLPDNTTSASSWLAALSQPGPDVHRPARSLVTASRDATIRVWQLQEDGAEAVCCGVLEGHTEWVSDLCLLGDSRSLVSSSADTSLRVWDLQTGLCTQTLVKHTDYVECLAYSHSSRLLASAGLSNQLYLWKLDANYPTPTECLSLPAHTGEQCHSLYALDMTPDGRLLATGGTDRVVRCWDTRSGSVWLQLLGHERLVRGVKVQEDGWQAVSVSADNVVKQWDTRKQRCIATWHIRDALLTRPAASASFATGAMYEASSSSPPSTSSLAVTDTFHKAYTGHSTGVVVCTDLSSGHSEPVAALPSAATAVRLDQTRHHLWCASFDSAVSCWDVRPTMTRHASFDADEEDELADEDAADDCTTLLHSPLIAIPGCPPLRRVKVTGDGWHVLAQDAHQSVQLWDVVSQRLVKDYGAVSFDELLQRKNASLTSQRPASALPSWFSLDLRLGCLCVHLTKQTAFAARYLVVAPPLPDELADKPADTVINLGEAALSTAFAEWLGLERLAWKVQMGEIDGGADGIEETEEQEHANLFSPLLSPTGRQKANGFAKAPAVSAAAIVGVSTSVIVSFPRAQRRTALYQSLPVPPLPVSLAPRLPSASGASFEECLMELDRRRAVYYQTMPGWVESSVMRAEEARPQRPAEDLLPDPFVTVNEWGFDDADADGGAEDEQEEAEDGMDDGEDSQASHAQDSLSAASHHLRSSAAISIQHSPASRPLPTHSPQQRYSLSSHSPALQSIERHTLQRPTPHSPSASPSSLSTFLTLQHPSIPKALSHPHLLHFASSGNSPRQRASLSSLSQSPLDSLSFDLNAPAYTQPPTTRGGTEAAQHATTRDSPTAAAPKTLFYLQPHTLTTQSPSPSPSPSHTLTVPTAPPSPSSVLLGSLPAVFHGPLLVPSSMSALRIKQYLSRKLNNSPALTRGDEGEEVTQRSLRFALADGTELGDEQTMGEIAAQTDSGTSKEKALRVWYRRQPVGALSREQSQVEGSGTAVTTEPAHNSSMLAASAGEENDASTNNDNSDAVL